MRAKYFFLAAILFFILVVWMDSELMAQCAMCRANVKSNLDANDGIGGVGHTLNNAILYLMAVPYLLISSLIYVFNKERIDAWVVSKWNAFKSGSKSPESSVEA